MQNFMITLLICSATMSVIALFYMAVTPFLVRRYSVASCYYAGLILVIGLIIPFRPQFVDLLSDGSFQTFWTDEAGTVNLSVERIPAGEITAIKRISVEEAQQYLLLTEGYDQNTINRLEAEIESKVKKRVNELYPES